MVWRKQFKQGILLLELEKFLHIYIKEAHAKYRDMSVESRTISLTGRREFHKAPSHQYETNEKFAQRKASPQPNTATGFQ